MKIGIQISKETQCGIHASHQTIKTVKNDKLYRTVMSEVGTRLINLLTIIKTNIYEYWPGAWDHSLSWGFIFRLCAIWILIMKDIQQNQYLRLLGYLGIIT